MPVDILRPRTWVKFKPEHCRNCQAGCCTLPLRVDSEDLFHMGFISLQEVSAPQKPIAERLIKAGIVKSYNTRRKLFMIRRHRNNDCIFLDKNRRCSIYDRRPYVCRDFPNSSARPGYCPYQAKPEPPTSET
jgi:Fe-S-cluster containining protein